MSRFVEVIDHPDLQPEHRYLIGMKGRVVMRYKSLGSVETVRLYLTDSTEVVVSENSVRTIPRAPTPE